MTPKLNQKSAQVHPGSDTLGNVPRQTNTPTYGRQQRDFLGLYTSANYNCLLFHLGISLLGRLEEPLKQCSDHHGTLNSPLKTRLHSTLGFLSSLQWFGFALILVCLSLKGGCTNPASLESLLALTSHDPMSDVDIQHQHRKSCFMVLGYWMRALKFVLWYVLYTRPDLLFESMVFTDLRHGWTFMCCFNMQGKSAHLN